MRTYRLIGIACCAMAALSASSPGPAVAQDDWGGPGSGRQMTRAVAIFASIEVGNAVKRKKSSEAILWHYWTGLYEYSAMQMPADWTWHKALKANIDFCYTLENQYANLGYGRHAALYRAMQEFYLDLWDQLSKSPKIVARFPKEMTVQVDGAPGTPWDPKTFEIVAGLALLKGTNWTQPAVPGEGEQLCGSCSGIRQWRCSNCLGSGRARYLKTWTGDPVGDTSYDRGGKGGVPGSCYNCVGLGWVRCTRCAGRGVVPR